MGVSASDYRARVRDLADVLILWDIDGTLVTHAPATRDRHAHAVGSVLGRPVDRLPAGVGKTDRQIILELFADHLPSDDELASALRAIDEVTAEDMRTSPSTANVGAADLLAHLAHAGASQSVLTGNTPERARLKVTTAHLADHIDFNSVFYGDVHSTRMDLVAAADAAWTIEEAGLLGRLGLGDDDGKATRVRSASPWWRAYAWAFEDCSEVLNLDAASSMRGTGAY